MIANDFDQQALMKYREVANVKREELGITEKLTSIKNKIKDSGFASIGEMKVIQSPRIDISKRVEEAKKHVSGKQNLGDSLLFFVGFPTLKYKDLKNRVIEQVQQFSPSNFFLQFI